MEFLEIRETSNTDDAKYLRAKERIAEVKKFYNKVLSYAMFIAFLGALNYYTNRWDYMWFLWAAFGWGIGLAFHAYKVYINDGMFGRNWERKKIEEFMREEEEKNRWN